MPNLMAEMLTPKEVSEATRFTVPTLATWRSRGIGPKFVRIMGRVYYRRQDVEAWLNEQMEQSA
ncbi:helix-turn-helix transcriptional regulator [Corynebacterium hindlerae]|uniref:helix-turn-helix transcriptional regulator n=1 Tax=Corynebacterium hindlerae TaxID=699041 RepID=UPI003AADC919